MTTGRDVLQAMESVCFAEGYHITGETYDGAVLARPKNFSILWSLVWLFCLGIGVLIYVFYYLGKKDEQIRLTLLGDGTPAAPYHVSMQRLNCWGKPDLRSFEKEHDDKRRATRWAVGIILVLFVGLPTLCFVSTALGALVSGQH